MRIIALPFRSTVAWLRGKCLSLPHVASPNLHELDRPLRANLTVTVQGQVEPVTLAVCGKQGNVADGEGCLRER